MGLSWWHLVIVLAVFVLLFGAGRISALMADAGKGFKSFRRAVAEGDEEKIRPEPVNTKPRQRNATRGKRA